MDKKPKLPKVTMQDGSDYAILWVGDEQIFCYHQSISSCFEAVAKALGFEFDELDIEEDEFDWDAADGMSLTEHLEVVRENRRKAVAEKVSKATAELQRLQRSLMRYDRHPLPASHGAGDTD